ncbi:ComEC/Rec2 family competence protein, partial [bacterium]|nr:ComEC/Rec2 family competence protein [bacterium]
MFKAFFANFSDKKFALMFLTSAIYILGLVGFYNNNVPLVLGLTLFILILGLIKEYISPKLAIFWLLIFSFAFLNAAHRHKQFDELFHLAPQNATIIGQVTTIPDNGLETRTRFFFDVKEITYENKTELVNAKTFVNVKGKPDIRIGETYKLEGKLRTPNTVSNPSQFDYEKYLKNLNVFTTFFVDDAPIKIETTLTPKWAFLQGLNNVRQDILESHSKNIQSPNIEVLGGIVFGDDAVSPPDNIKQSFKDAGILHILAASGMNVALIFGIFFFIFRLLKIPSTIGNILGIFIIVLYTLMTGMGASIIRAAVILVFILIGKLIDRDAHSLSLLSFVALLMLIFNPSYINDVGFQLSFIVTFGLLLMTTPVLSKFNNIMPHWLSSSIFIPVIAQLWVAPIQMFYFNSFTLYSVFANILIMPFITVISFGG